MFTAQPVPLALVHGRHKSDAHALAIVRAACLAHLKTRAAKLLKAPVDWSRESVVGCKCEHCAALARFLADPQAKTWSLKVAEPIRRHIEGTVRAARSDVDVQTDRRGRPNALVCTKNQASYERRIMQRRKDLADIATLERA